MTLADVAAFIHLELRLLDERRFDEWRDLFTEDGIYWAPTQPDQDSPESAVSLFYDDRVTMQARIRRFNHPDVHVQVPASRTVHLVTNIEIEQDDGITIAHAAFAMAEYRIGTPTWYAGRYEYRLQPEPTRIIRKKVTLVNCDGAFNSMAIYL